MAEAADIESVQAAGVSGDEALIVHTKECCLAKCPGCEVSMSDCDADQFSNGISRPSWVVWSSPRIVEGGFYAASAAGVLSFS